MKCILVGLPGVQEDDFVTLITNQQDNVHQNKNPNKCVCFSELTKSPKPIPHETPDLDFTLGMNITFKSGTGMSENVVYK